MSSMSNHNMIKKNKILVDVEWWHVQPKKQSNKKSGVDKIWERRVRNIDGPL